MGLGNKNSNIDSSDDFVQEHSPTKITQGQNLFNDNSENDDNLQDEIQDQFKETINK